MTGLWIVAVVALVVALAALAQARRTARQLAQITEMYWQLKFDHGELKAKVDPPAPAPPEPQQTFVPLSSIKPGRGRWLVARSIPVEYAPSLIARTAPSMSGAAEVMMICDEREILADDLQQVDAAERRLPHVRDQHVDVFAIHQRQAGLGGDGADDPEVAPQRLRQPLARLILGVDYENGLASGGIEGAV